MSGGMRSGNGAVAALLILALVNLLNYYDRMLVVVVSQTLRLEFHLTDTQYGLLSGPAFVLVYAIASLVFGYLADRRNRRTVVTIALAAWSGMTAVCGMANTFWMLALARAGVGVGEGGANPASMSMLSDHFPPQRRSMAMAVYSGGGMLGLFLSFVLGSWINTHYGWRAVFLVAAVPGLVLAAVVYLWLQDPERGRFDRVRAGPGHYRSDVWALLTNRAYLLLCLGAALGSFGSLGMLMWLPQFFIRTHALTGQQVGLLFGPAAALGLFLGMLLGGWWGNRLARTGLHRPVLICIAANLLTVPLYLGVLWTPAPYVALATMFVAMGMATVYAPAFQAAMHNVVDPALRATATAFANLIVASIGQGLIPFLVGATSDALLSSHGSDALRWSLSLSQGFILLSVVLFTWALLAMRRQLSPTPPTP